MKLLPSLAKQNGASMFEYALIVVTIAVICITAVHFVGVKVGRKQIGTT